MGTQIMNLADLQQIMPGTTRAAVFIRPLLRAMDEFGIDTVQQRADFLGNVGHETGGLSVFEEKLNYRAQRLMEVWPTRFPTLKSTIGLAHNPVALANHVYANRMGNGDEKSGDGWRFRGAGGIQLTGRKNQSRCAAHFGIPINEISDWLRTPVGAARSAAWFYTERSLHLMGDFDKICDLINIGRETERIGDAIGYKDRLAIRNRAMAILT
jgi:putative chitinase